jgi:hypothetical protein
MRRRKDEHKEIHLREAYFRVEHAVFHWNALSVLHLLLTPRDEATVRLEKYKNVKSVFLFTAEKIHIAIFWIMTSSCLVVGYERCEGIYCFYLQGTVS